jgi:hypothetical protein
MARQVGPLQQPALPAEPQNVKRALAALVTLLVLPLQPALAAVSTDTGIGIRLLEAPVQRRDDPRAHVYIVDHVSPGASFSRRIEVVNDSPADADLSLYAVGSQIANGSFSPLPGRTPNELSTWISVEPATAHLAPRARQTAVVRVQVPADAAPGERYAAVMAESSTTNPSGIAVNTRVGIRVYLDIGPGGEPASDFAIDSLTASRGSNGQPIVEATVRNTGGRALDMSGTLQLSNGPGGLSAGPFPAELGTTLAIGQGQPVKVVLDKALPAGPWKARIELKSGLLDRAAEATITFPDAVGARSAPVTARPVPLVKDPSVVEPVAIGLLVLVAALLALVLWRRRRTDDERQQADPSGDAVPVQRHAPDDRVVR